jgi:predicted neuraminidase
MNRTRFAILAAAILTAAPLRAGEPGLVMTEFLYETAPFPSCHASTLVETSEGLVAAFFGGTHERHPDVCIWVCRQVNGQWTPPQQVATGLGFDTNRYPTWNPVLFQPRQGPLLLFYKVGPSPSAWWGMVMTSTDAGRTWSAPRRLPDGILGPIKNKPVQLANGDILSPSSTEGEAGWRIHFERSTDGGQTWASTGPIPALGSIQAIQPSILVHPGGRLQALGRTREGRIFQTWSLDNGQTWEPLTLTELPNPNSGTDAVTLSDGRHLLVYNHNPLRSGRKPLNVALSDDGRTWHGALVLEDDFSKRDGFAYPSVIQTRDGLVHVVYTWDRKRIKHAVIDPRRLQTRPIVDGAWPGETNSIGIELASIPAGAFVMGNPAGDWDEQNTHEVVIPAPFKLSMDEVTLAQYQQFRPQHRCSLQGKATGVSWYDAVAFCDWLSKREGKPYRLPTEAEWEYACRASTRSPFWSGDQPPPDRAPNPWNLRGTHDAVMEWCADWHAPYPLGSRTNPVGPAGGLVKVVRGDKPDDDSRLKDEPGRQAADYRGSANRAGLPPAFGVAKMQVGIAQAEAGEDASASPATPPGWHHVGFRVVQAPPPATPPSVEPAPFARQLVKRPPPRPVLRQAPDQPYFRKRYLLPIPPDNSPPRARAAAGLHPAIRGHNHSPALEVCPNGDLLLILYTSNFEYEPGVSLLGARLRFGAEEWDFPEPLFDTPDVNDHGPLLFTDWKNHGKLWLFWGWPKMRAGAYPFQWMTSEDSGATWSEVRFPQFTTPIGPHSRQPINSAFRDKRGTLFVASDARKTDSVLWATRDHGRTWQDTGGRTAGRHTTFALLRNGAILGMGGKSTDIEGYMPQAVSRDGGRTWVVSKTPFPAQGVNQRPSLLRLSSGRLLFAADFQRRGNVAPEGVTDRGCYVAVSDDDGATWRFKKLPGTQPHEKPEYQADPDTLGYTVLRQAPNGMIHLVTTMNTPCLHFEFNEAWVLSGQEETAQNVMASTAVTAGRLRSFTEKWPGGRLKARWSGTVADDGRFLLEGREEWFFQDGSPNYVAAYHLGRKTGLESFWRAPGQLAWQRQHGPDGECVWTQYWDNGRKKAESVWRDSKADGPARLWDREGNLVSEAAFEAGALKEP